MRASRSRLSPSALGLGLLLVCAGAASPAHAQGHPPFGEPKPPRIPARSREYREPRPREPWMRNAIRVGAVVPTALYSASLSKWFGPRPGYSFWLVTPLQPAVDFDVVLDAMDMPMRAGKVGRELGTLDPGSRTLTTIGSLGVGISVHPVHEGLRPFASAALMLPDISQPAIFYTDGSGGRHTLDGSEIFGLDPGYQVGAGVEWRQPGAVGAELDARLWAVPGRTRPAVVLIPVRLMISIPIPEW